jgi:hypothetical protein
VRPTIFYGSDSEELAFFVEDARKAARPICGKWIAMVHAVFLDFAFDFNPGKFGQQCFERNNFVRGH